MKSFLDREGFDKHLGYTYLNSDEFSSHLQLEIQDYHKNIHGYVHGGLYYSLSDAAAGFVVMEISGNWVTLNASINYIKAVNEGIIDVYATRISKTSKLAVIEVEVKSGSQLLTKGTYTMYRIDK